MIKTHPKSKFTYMKSNDISRYNVLQFEQCGHEQGEYHLVIAETISDADAKEEYYTKAEVDAIKSEYEKTIANTERNAEKPIVPQPLTFDELRKMNGQPVWVLFKTDADGAQLRMWCLVENDPYGSCYLTNSYGGRDEFATEKDIKNAKIQAIYPYCF